MIILAHRNSLSTVKLMPDNKNLFIGLMSGTSMDAIDAALVDISNDTLHVIDYHQYPLPGAVQKTLGNITGSTSVHDISALDVTVAELFAGAVRQSLSRCGKSADAISAIGSHGQTILHLPGEEQPRTLQIGDPNIIAYQTGITTILPPVDKARPWPAPSMTGFFVTLKSIALF